MQLYFHHGASHLQICGFYHLQIWHILLQRMENSTLGIRIYNTKNHGTINWLIESATRLRVWSIILKITIEKCSVKSAHNKQVLEWIIKTWILCNSLNSVAYTSYLVKFGENSRTSRLLESRSNNVAYTSSEGTRTLCPIMQDGCKLSR